MTSSRRLLVVGAHSADFVWRAGGVVAAYLGGGARHTCSPSRTASAASRESSGKSPARPSRTSRASATRRRGARPRRSAPSSRASTSATTPSRFDRRALELLADRIREVAPHVLITHTDRDPFNPTTPSRSSQLSAPVALAAGAGVPSAFETIEPPVLFLFRAAPAGALQLHADNVRRHHIRVRSQASGDGGDEGAAVSAELLRGARGPPGQPRRRSSANAAIRYAEAFQRVTPQVLESL